MHVYAIADKSADDTEPVVFRGTLAEAKDAAKEGWTPTFRGSVRIVLVDVATHKDSLVWLLNNPRGLTHSLLLEKPLRAWKVSNRGGIQEIVNNRSSS